MVKIKPPNISESTEREMAEFFMKTSIPRILATIEKGEMEVRNGKLEWVKNENESSNRDNSQHRRK